MLRSLLIILGLLCFAQSASAGVWRSDRPHKAVVVGGSISMFYDGNFGQYLQFGCTKLEVINRGQVGAGGAKLLKNLREQVVEADDVRPGLGKGWILFQGGLNSVFAPESTVRWLSRLMSEAHAAGLRVLVLTLTPWGSEEDPRFQGWRGLAMHRATEHVVEWALGHLTPKQALGSRLKQRGGDPEKWSREELPDIAVDMWRSALRVGPQASLRPREPLEASFATSPFRKRAEEQDKLVEAARAVPRQYLQAAYRSFDHTHPNSAGHRMMAALACQQAPAEWSCDCDAIRRARYKGGKMVLGK